MSIMAHSTRTIVRRSALLLAIDGCHASRLCSCCILRRQSAQIQSALQHRAYAQKPKPDLQWTEKVRRRIWGTDNPPGQKDPYSFEERDRIRRGEIEHEHESNERPAAGAPTPESSLPTSRRRKSEQRRLKSDAGTPATPDQYQAASTWDGLERIGGANGWWEDAWDKQNFYHGFAPKTAVEPSQVESFLRRALIEVYTAQAAEAPLRRLSDIPEDESLIDYDSVSISYNKTSGLQLSFADEAMREELIGYLQNQSAVKMNADEIRRLQDEAASTMDASTANEDRPEANDEYAQEDAAVQEAEAAANALDEPVSEALLDRSWLQAPLTDLDLRFALLKRLMQLTGIRIGDAAAARIQNIDGILQHLAAKEAPVLLADILKADSQLASLPNVEIHNRRQTPIDKQQEVGRWKIIEQELQRRGLPVTGVPNSPHASASR